MTRYDPTESLGFLVNRAARLMAAELSRRLEVHGVAIGQWAVLFFLYQRDGLSQAELSREVAIEPPTVVRTVERMVRDGLVERRSDPHDARLVRVYLTEKSRGLQDQLVAESQAVNAMATAALGDESAELLRAQLRVLIAALTTSGPNR